jgi:peptidoglycan/LPS O-acetylase OafA/YrhL
VIPAGEAADQYASVVTGFTLGKRPALDGLRGVAILFVLGTHTFYLWPNLPWFRGGFIGVDIFFALSGFLITSILVEEFDRSGQVSLPRFYRRRAYRLLPALAVVLLFTFAYTLFFRADWPFRTEVEGITAIAFYVENWLQIVRPGAWGLGQLWSLGIEEQFYLLWPILLVALLRINRPRVTANVVMGLIVASGLLCAVTGHFHPTTLNAYLETQDRVGELLVGAAASLLLHDGWRPGVWIRPAGWCAAGFLGWVLFTNVSPTSPWFNDGGYTLVALAATIVILATLAPGGGLYRLLTLSPLRFLGHISYSFYLWHIPVITVISDYQPMTGGALERCLIALPVTFALALASYRWIEQPFLQMNAVGLHSPGYRRLAMETSRPPVGVQSNPGPVGGIDERVLVNQGVGR